MYCVNLWPVAIYMYVCISCMYVFLSLFVVCFYIQLWCLKCWCMLYLPSNSYLVLEVLMHVILKLACKCNNFFLTIIFTKFYLVLSNQHGLLVLLYDNQSFHKILISFAMLINIKTSFHQFTISLQSVLTRRVLILVPGQSISAHASKQPNVVLSTIY